MKQKLVEAQTPSLYRINPKIRMLEQLLNEMKVIKHENEEMKQQGAFHFGGRDVTT